MIKLKNILFEQWTKRMGKPLSKSEISALEKKIKASKVRDPKKGGKIIPPKLSKREKNHIIFVMLKKTRDKAKRMHLDKLAK